MANDEHLKKLNEGIETWNDWRKPNTERPDLGGELLSPAAFVEPISILPKFSLPSCAISPLAS